VTELAAAGRPALMIPLPNSIDDHQMANADSLSSRGGGWVMSESAFSPENVAARLASILSDGAGLARAAAAARASARTDAAERLADLVLGLVPGALKPLGRVH
jgi:UDP-N-acetylglucosamine--N-acetylmuramyl-(pentapeptide) pyrophosphoryl-undecaprenol N-acetylglucosamine transferase